MNKKKLIIFITILVVILVGVFFVFLNYKVVNTPVGNLIPEIKNPDEIKSPEQKIEEPKIELSEPEIKIENPKPNVGLYVCNDQCGDSICQPAGTICKDKLNCICAETKEDCPGDCN